FKEYSSSKLQFPKLHSWVFHICSSIREFGAINGCTTETYESLHKDYVKKPYKLTNKKEIEKQIMKIVSIFYSKNRYITFIKFILTHFSLDSPQSYHNGKFLKRNTKNPNSIKIFKKLYEFCIQNAEIY